MCRCSRKGGSRSSGNWRSFFRSDRRWSDDSAFFSDRSRKWRDIGLDFQIGQSAAARRRETSGYFHVLLQSDSRDGGGSLLSKRRKSAGVDGVIIPDMIPEEGAPLCESRQAKNGIDLIYLGGANHAEGAHSHDRLQDARLSLCRVFDRRDRCSESASVADVAGFLKSVKSVSKKPVAVGFGISTPQQVARDFASCRWSHRRVRAYSRH